MSKKEKDSLIIKEGDLITIDSSHIAYKQKSYVVLSVTDNVIRCRVDVKNILNHKECTYFKDELSNEMIEKFSHRGEAEKYKI